MLAFFPLAIQKKEIQISDKTVSINIYIYFFLPIFLNLNNIEQQI